MDKAADALLQEQIAYYRARANEYDQWFLRLGRYDRGPEWNTRWFGEVEELARLLEDFGPRGDLLELACGTGWWTAQLARYADTITAVDASPEVLALNRERLGEQPVNYIHADLFDWRPDQQYDLIFFSFWLSHVPPERFEPFWELVRSSLRPGGRFFLIDSLATETSSAVDHRYHNQQESITQVRRLNDGNEYTIYKLFYQPSALEARLKALGWEATVATTPTYFLYASGHIT